MGVNRNLGRRLPAVLAPIILFLAIPGPLSARLVEGDSVGVFSLEKRAGGETAYPQDFQGQVVLLCFWASWCPECKAEMPLLASLQDEFRGRPFALLAVNADQTRKAAERFLEKHPTGLSVFLDPGQKLIRSLSPVGMPAAYLVGRDGRIHKVYVGLEEDALAGYRKDIEALLGAMPPAGTPAGQEPPQKGGAP